MLGQQGKKPTHKKQHICNLRLFLSPLYKVTTALDSIAVALLLRLELSNYNKVLSMYINEIILCLCMGKANSKLTVIHHRKHNIHPHNITTTQRNRNGLQLLTLNPPMKASCSSSSAAARIKIWSFQMMVSYFFSHIKKSILVLLFLT